MNDPNSKSAIQRAVENVGSQSQLAAKVGVTQGRVWQWCNGERIPAHRFQIIAEVGGVTVADLLADEMTKSIPSKKKNDVFDSAPSKKEAA